MANKKKITILVLHLQHGGIEKQTITLANELAKKYSVEIICVYTMKKEPAYCIDSRIKIKYLIDDFPNKKEFIDALKKKQIIKLLQEGIKAIKILNLKSKLMMKEIKKLDSDVVLSTRIEYAEMLSKYAPAEITTITQEHLHNDSSQYIKRLKNAIKNIDYLIALGPGSKENYERWFSTNKKTKIVEIPNILENNSEKESLRKTYNIIAVGRMHPVKGFKDLLKVVKTVKEKIPEVKLTIIGGGEEYDSLNTEKKKMDLDECVTMPGMLNSREITEQMLKSDIYVMTSYSECFPMVLLEAASCGLPLVAFDVPVGPRALIKDNFNGYLIQNRDIKEMTEKIIYLFENRDKMNELGNNSKENVKQYLPENVMKKWYEILDK